MNLVEKILDANLRSAQTKLTQSDHVSMNTRVKRLKLTDFTAFKDLDIQFSPGINVIIGENSTGKTHLMKVLYSILKCNEEASRDRIKSVDGRQTSLARTLVDVFKPDSLGRLARRQVGVKNARVSVDLGTSKGSIQSYDFSFSTKSTNRVKLKNFSEVENLSCLYIPVMEMLTMYPGFIANYINQEVPYDKTFYDIAVALNNAPKRGPRLQDVKELMEPIEEATRIRVRNEAGKFYLKVASGANMEAPLVAEGLKKLGMLIYLIGNGSLTKNSILFWDEPEAHLNPKYIRVVVEFLRVLADRGVQIFIATHDYLLSQRLSLIAETKSTPKDLKIKFISLYRTKDQASRAETGDNLLELEKNSILDEFASYAEEEDNY